MKLFNFLIFYKKGDTMTNKTLNKVTWQLQRTLESNERTVARRLFKMIMKSERLTYLIYHI